MRDVTVRHPPLDPGDDESLDAFESALAKGFKKWFRLNEFTPDVAFQNLRATLLQRLQRQAALLITNEAVANIHGAASAAEGRATVQRICQALAKFLRSDLIWMSGLPLHGRTHQFSVRDRRIHQLRRKGFSYGAIGRQLGLKRNAVQAAYRRERQRRQVFYSHHANFRQLLAMCGINLEEDKRMAR